jgi:hypothetical protein
MLPCFSIFLTLADERLELALPLPSLLYCEYFLFEFFRWTPKLVLESKLILLVLLLHFGSIFLVLNLSYRFLSVSSLARGKAAFVVVGYYCDKFLCIPKVSELLSDSIY